MGYIVGHFEDEYYIVSLCSENKYLFVTRKNGLWNKIKATEVLR